MSVEFLSCRYMSEHPVDDNNDTFGDFFSPDTNSKRCHICELGFDNCTLTHVFITI